MLLLKTHVSSNENLKKSWKLCSTREKARTPGVSFCLLIQITGIYTQQLKSSHGLTPKHTDLKRSLVHFQHSGPYNTVGGRMTTSYPKGSKIQLECKPVQAGAPVSVPGITSKQAVTASYNQPSGCQKFCMPGDSSAQARGDLCSFQTVCVLQEKEDRYSAPKGSN